MSFVWNLPLFMIITCLFSAALCLLLPQKAAAWLTGAVQIFCLVGDGLLLRFTLQSGSFTYSMGEFPAPWGNELRAGILECLVLLVFLLVIFCSFLAGYHYMQIDVDESKQGLYFILLHLVTAATIALVFTNDIFTGYVFLEILTLACCGLLIVREVGRTTLAATRYMIMNLLGSGLYLLGVILLYGMTGHLLMVPMHESIAALASDPSMLLPLSFAVGVLTIGLAIKSGLFPFHFWMPDTYGWATPTTASIMSSVVSKAYIFLLIKIFYRVVGMEVLVRMPIETILFVLGIAGMVFGSLSALRANNINRMIAFSSAAQIGYIFMSIGIIGPIGCTAAIFHMLGHAVTKSLLFLTTPHLADVSGNSLQFRKLQGSALRDPMAGLLFTAAAFSMIGIPVFAGFSSKFLIALAGAERTHLWTLFPVLAALVISSILNALYFIRTIIRIFTRQEEEETGKAMPLRFRLDYVLPAFLLLGINLCMGLFPSLCTNLIERGLAMLP